MSWDWKPVSQREVAWELGEKVPWLLYNPSRGNGGSNGICGLWGALNDVATWVPAEGTVTLSLVLPLCCRWQSSGGYAVAQPPRRSLAPVPFPALQWEVKTGAPKTRNL